MKKVFLSLIALVALSFASNAQTEEGMKFLEINTAFGDNITGGNIGGTGFQLSSIDGTTIWNVGAEGGFFVIDDLAIKGGLGFGGTSTESTDTNAFSYKIGGKYYISSVAPIEVSLNGTSIKDAQENPLWLGLQGGYGIFVADNVSIEPGVRYNISLNENLTDEGVFQGNIGFVLFLN